MNHSIQAARFFPHLGAVGRERRLSIAGMGEAFLVLTGHKVDALRSTWPLSRVTPLMVLRMVGSAFLMFEPYVFEKGLL